MKISGYDVTSSNSSAKQQGSVRVKFEGVVLACVYSFHSAPLKRLRTYPQCSERIDLVQQLKRNNVPSEIIAEIVRLPMKENHG